jgi:hypothetical protein
VICGDIGASVYRSQQVEAEVPYQWLSPRLDLPDDLQFLAHSIIFNRGERYKVLSLPAAGGKNIGWKRTLRDINNHVTLPPDVHHLSRLRHRYL